jgi:hypothetical protein
LENDAALNFTNTITLKERGHNPSTEVPNQRYQSEGPTRVLINTRSIKHRQETQAA